MLQFVRGPDCLPRLRPLDVSRRPTSVTSHTPEQGVRNMVVRGGCLCRSIEFEVDLPFLKFVNVIAPDAGRQPAVPLPRTRMSCLRLFVGSRVRMTWCASIFLKHEASRHRSVDTAVHRFRTPLVAVARLLSLQAPSWMTQAHRQRSIRAGVRALAGYQMPLACRPPTKPLRVSLAQ